MCVYVCVCVFIGQHRTARYTLTKAILECYLIVATLKVYCLVVTQCEYIQWVVIEYKLTRGEVVMLE